MSCTPNAGNSSAGLALAARATCTVGRQWENSRKYGALTHRGLAEWGIPVVLNVLAQCLALGTHDAAAPSATLGIISAKTPAARQPQVGSSSCFRQLRAQGYGHVSTSWLVELDVVRGDKCPRQLSCTRATCHTTPVTW